MNKTDLSVRDLFCKVMRFECPGRTIATLGGIWPQTLDRWRSEGMPPRVKTFADLFDYLGLQPHLWGGPNADIFLYPQYEYRVVRETAEKLTWMNENGIIVTEFKDHRQTMPHFEEFPLKSRSDWPEFKKRLEWNDARVGDSWQQQKAEWERRDLPLIVALNRAASLYGSLREMFGVEELSYLFYDDPKWIEEIMDTMVELFLHVVDALFTDFTPDAVCMWEDMAYKTSSLLSVHHVRQFMLPRCKVMTAKLREKRIPFILLDSDGNIDELIPIWLEAGIDGFVPMEAQAGMDVGVYRDRYPKMLMLGGIDKKALAQGRKAIDAEIEMVRHAIASGGYVPWFDHGLPHDVSYQNFLYYVERLKEVTGLASH